MGGCNFDRLCFYLTNQIETGVINKCRNGRKKIEKLKHLETNPGIECCDNYNVDPKCFLLCKQLDNPVNNTEESSGDMTCEDFSGVINKCRNGKENIEDPVFID